jgi:hypothetical protein
LYDFKGRWDDAEIVGGIDEAIPGKVGEDEGGGGGVIGEVANED